MEMPPPLKGHIRDDRLESVNFERLEVCVLTTAI
jgi:hypothetical protein